MERVLMKGNEIIGEAAIRSGCRLFFGYPITPSTEVIEYLNSTSFFKVHLNSLFHMSYEEFK